jgi:hypothetical protein
LPLRRLLGDLGHDIPSSYFAIYDMVSDSGGDLITLWRADDPPRKRPEVERVQLSVRNARYKKEGWGRRRYAAAMERPYALRASDTASGILELPGDLDRTGQKQHQEAIASRRTPLCHPRPRAQTQARCSSSSVFICSRTAAYLSSR